MTYVGTPPEGVDARRDRFSRYMDREDRAPMLRARVLAVATLVTGFAYIVWLFFRLNRDHLWMASAFMAAEIVCLLLFLMGSFTVWRLRHKPPEGLPSAEAFGVDVFITVCGEPLRIVRSTLEAAMAIEWDGPMTIHVLDDGASDAVRALAEQHGVLYSSRPRSRIPPEHAKAGNLNFGLARSAWDYILVLDADQVPRRWILRALAGYMRFPRVAFVQSRQFFLVPQGDPFFNLDRVFYEAVQLGNDNHDHALSCGSGVLYRREALLQNGGFSTWNVVEDLTTSYNLHSRGWRSFYFPHAVTTGLAPADIWGVYHQRSQWALDTLRLFFWDPPFVKRGLSWKGRVSYLVLQLAYLSAGFVFPLFFIIPPWTYVTGASVLTGSELQFALVRGLYFVTMALGLRALFRRHEAGRQFQMLVGLFPVYAMAALRAVLYPPNRRRGPRYAPNNRAPQNGLRWARWPAAVAVAPQLLLLAANLLLPFYAIISGSAASRLIVTNAVISGVAVWSLLPAVVAALGRPVWDRQMSPFTFYGRAAEADS
jgi:cellulose synthase (UDP-forming)